MSVSINLSGRKNITQLPRSTRLVNKMLFKYYKQVNNFQKEGKPVAWIGMDFPPYFLWAMDIVPVFPQIDAAFQAQRKRVKKMMNELESKWEIPHNICGEVKGVLGAVLFDNEIPFRVPKPDILITTNCSCNSMSKAFKYLRNHLNTELLYADFPFVYDEITDEMVEFSSSQIQKIIDRLEASTGKKLGYEKLSIIYENFQIIMKLWEEICLLNTMTPAPVESLDLFLFSSVMIMLEVDEKLVDLYVLLYNEVFEQTIKNQDKGYKENFRLLWHYLPIYSQKKFFKNLFDEYGATVVTGTFFPLSKENTAGWDYNINYPVTKTQVDEMRNVIRDSGVVENDINSLVKNLARTVLNFEVNRSVEYKNEKIKRLIDEYSIDGVIMHCDRSCRPQSLPQYEMKRYLTEELNFPVLLFDADTMDDRYFAPSQITTRFEAFVEKIDTRIK